MSKRRYHGTCGWQGVIGNVNAKKWVQENAEEVEYRRIAGEKPLRVKINGKNSYFKTYAEAYFKLNN